MNALEQVERLLEQMHEAIKDPKRFEQASDALHTLVSAHLIPAVTNNFEGIRLAHSERRVAEILHDRLGQGVTKQVIFNALYFDRMDDDEPEFKIVDVFVCKLRKKLAEANSPYHIETIWGRGYRLINKSEQAKAA